MECLKLFPVELSESTTVGSSTTALDFTRADERTKRRPCTIVDAEFDHIGPANASLSPTVLSDRGGAWRGEEAGVQRARRTYPPPPPTGDRFLWRLLQP